MKTYKKVKTPHTDWYMRRITTSENGITETKMVAYEGPQKNIVHFHLTEFTPKRKVDKFSISKLTTEQRLARGIG